MAPLFDVSWQSMFVPSVPLAELVLRGSFVYLALFLFMRFLLKREAGELGIADLLVVVLIADASQNAMACEYKSVTDGIVLVGTIVAWNYFFDWLAYRFEWFERFAHPHAVILIANGRLLRRNMKKELVTEEELMSQLRQQGVLEVKDVKRACMEGDGHISVVKKEPSEKKG